MIRRAFQFVRGMALIWISANLLMAAGSVCSVLFPSILGQLLDHPAEYLKTGTLLMGLLSFSAAAGYGRTRLMALLSVRIAGRLRMALMEKLMRVPQRFFVVHSSGELLSIAGNDVNLFQNALSGGITYVLNTILSLVMALFFMIRLDALMTLVLLLTTALIFGANLLFTRGVTGVSKKTQEQLAEINSLASQGILGNQELRAYRMEQTGLSMMRAANGAWEGSTLRLERIRAKSSLLMGLLSAVQLVGLIMLGLHRVNQGLLTAGTLASFILYAQSVSGPLTSAASLAVDIRRSLAAISRVLGILDEPEPQPGSRPLPQPVRGEIEVDQLTFSYPVEREDKPDDVLSGVSLTIPAGTTAALVGESGSGKTTLMKLIAGFLPAGQGDIRIDGLSVRDVSPDALRDAVAVVSQNPFLFQVSVRDNIAFGRPDAGDEEIIRAAKLACAHEFIMKLPDGYDTVLGENGVNLSGGQRQRIAIARAFLKNSPILLLDEATSALDNRAEAEIQAALEQLMKARTTLIIAHRLSTVRHADCIHYMENGRILASAPHEELMNICPAYREMHDRANVSLDRPDAL